MPTQPMMWQKGNVLFVVAFGWQSTRFSLCVNDTNVIQVNIGQIPCMFWDNWVERQL